MIWTGIAVSLICIGPVAWMFYRGYASDNRLKKQLKALAMANHWHFGQAEINGGRLCAIDRKNAIVALVHDVKGVAKVSYATLNPLVSIRYSAGGINEEEEPCNLIVDNGHSFSTLQFYTPGIDNAIKYRDLEQFGQRWFAEAQKVAVKSRKPEAKSGQAVRV